MADRQTANPPRNGSPDHRLEMAMGTMLRVGVTLAAALVLAGGIVFLRQTAGPPPDYRHFHGAPPDDLRIGSILSGAIHWHGSSLIQFGILLLIATPVCRVLFGVVGFSRQRDWFYAGVSAVVLVVLLFSLIGNR